MEPVGEQICTTASAGGRRSAEGRYPVCPPTRGTTRGEATGLRARGWVARAVSAAGGDRPRPTPIGDPTRRHGRRASERGQGGGTARGEAGKQLWRGAVR